jgi:amicyanin
MPVTRHRAFSTLSFRTIMTLVASLAVAAASLALAGGTRAGTSHAVEIADFAFSPQSLTIQVGDTVTWTNLDQVAHTATSTTGAFDSGLFGQNESYSFTFTQAGTYDYLCTPHPTMTGRIVVEAAPAAPAPSQATGGGGTIPDVAMRASASEPIDPRVPIGVALLAMAGTIAVIAGVRRWRASAD